MPGQSSSDDVPAKYRIGLALSTAFLVHILIFSGFPSPVLEAPKLQHSIQFELLPRGTNTSMPNASSVPRKAAEKTTKNRNPAFEISPDKVDQPSLSQITTQSSDQKTLKKKPISKAEPQKSEIVHQRLPSSARLTTSESKPAQPATASHAGHQTTHITQSPSERDPYLITLAVHLGKELEKLRVPAISQLSQKVTMEIELRLLGNGGLTRARVLKSTGIKKIDEAAYRASLAASPYPEPPSDEIQNRFEIELVFSPKRL